MKKELMFSGPAFRKDKKNTVGSNIPGRMKQIFGKNPVQTEEVIAEPEPEFKKVNTGKRSYKKRNLASEEVVEEAENADSPEE